MGMCRRPLRRPHSKGLMHPCIIVPLVLAWLISAIYLVRSFGDDPPFTLPPIDPPFTLPPRNDKVLIVSLSTGKESDSYREALKNQESYAKCHGYKFLNAQAARTTGETSVHPFMQKAFALQNIMASREYSVYDYILWIDRDAIFMDHRISISDRLHQLLASTIKEGAFAGTHPEVFGYDLFVAVESWAWLNSGVLLFKNTSFSRKIVDDWISTYRSREAYYNSPETILISRVPKTFRNLFAPKWSCEDQGALIALLAGYNLGQKWKTDRFDGLGVPHVLHKGHAQWAALSTYLILDAKYQTKVKIVAQEWLNTNPWDQAEYEANQKKQGHQIIEPFIFHFNGQNYKPELIHKYSKDVKKCSAQDIEEMKYASAEK